MNKHKPGLSILIPAYNEANNARSLVERLEKTLRGTGLAYEIIFVDDHSKDKTRSIVKALGQKFPVKLYLKQGRQGKAYSLLEAVTHAQYDFVAMLDADLQYPPEVIPDLYKLAQIHGVAVANRKTYKTTLLRRLASRANAFIFGRVLLGLNTDVQSGLKIVKREVFEHLDQKLISAWAIDIPLLFTAHELGFSVGHVDIDFRPRTNGQSKVKFFETAWQIATGAIKTKLKRRLYYLVSPPSDQNMLSAGIAYQGKRFITHTTLTHQLSAIATLTTWQKLTLIIFLATLASGLMMNPAVTLIAAIALLSAIYFLDVLFNLYVILKSLNTPPEITFDPKEVGDLKDQDLPIYTILCPLYREARILPQFVKAIESLDWPKAKLEVLLLFEHDDQATMETAKTLNLPDYMRIVEVPDSLPKTKPKACNYGLGMATGEIIVVFDAEDIPEPTQLKKAYLAFQKASKSVICLQAKLNYYNPHHNLLTRLFTAEYSLWFDVVLPGLQSIETTIPLGGTSNHFRTKDLLKLEGWDPFNVTEDCDLGARLFKSGYRTAIIDSETEEEANSKLGNWFRQRSRWMKGYIQTYFVHMRRPLAFAREHGVHALIFQLVVGGKVAFMLINPFLWLATISYFTLYSFVGPAIESLYPAPVFYVAVFSLVFGNFIYLYNYMIGCAKRGHWDLIKYIFFVPFYWLTISIGAALAVLQLFFKPHYWEKTVHGLYFDFAEKEKLKDLAKIQSASKRAAVIKRWAGLTDSGLVSGGILVLASLLGSFLNFLYNSYLGRTLALEQFGIIGLIGSFVYISGVPLGALSRTVTHRSAYLFGRFGAPIKRFWEKIRKQSLIYAVIISIIWVVLIPFFHKFFQTNDIIPFVLFTPVWFIGALSAVDRGFLGGNLRFSTLAILAISEAFSKLLISITLVHFGLASYVYAAIPISMVMSFSIGWWSAVHIKSKISVKDGPQISFKFPKKFYFSSILTNLTGIAYLSLDVILVKHYLNPIDAGTYSFLSLVGQMVYLFAGLFTQFIIPMVSRDIGAGDQPRKTFGKLILLIIFANLAGFLAFGIFGSITVPLLWGTKALGVIPYLIPYTAAMVAFSLSTTMITYHQIKNEHLFSFAGLAVGLIEVLGISMFHENIQMVTYVVALSGFLMVAVIFVLDRTYGLLIDIYRNGLDLIGLFGRLPALEPLPNGHKRILIFNWRDIRHKWAGGAEVYVHELGKRWVAKGHEVTLFCGNDGNNPRYELIDGVRIIRRGGFYFVYIWAFLYYLYRLKGRYDVIIDSENGIPFFTPIYASEKIYLLIHHVHQEVFRKRLHPPLSWIAMFLEKRLMPLTYRNTAVFTISPSSRTEILLHNLTKKEPKIIYCGVDLTVCKPGKKNNEPLVLYLGRLTKLKSISIFIQAAKKILSRLPHVQFIIAGDGPDKKRLMKIVQKLGLEQNISFTGKVSDSEKITLYQKAWVFVNPSLIEGWGITTIEANACGAPVVASNVSGLRDAVKNPHSGFLVPYGDIDAFSRTIAKLIENDKLRKELSEGAIEWAKNFDWDKSADEFLGHILNDAKYE